jgi:hypothetical protein
MTSTIWRNRSSLLLASVLVMFTSTAWAQARTAATPDPGLVGMLTKQLGVTQTQATGGAGALFSLAKDNLSSADFSKISSVVPGMNGFLKAAPKTEQGSAAPATSAASNLGPLSGAANAAGASAASAASNAGGGILSLGNSFKALGMSPDMATKFAPVVQQYLGGKGGSGVASIFSKAVGI